jgi:antitoxin component HigA of HigAB toxin-antitoxin module
MKLKPVRNDRELNRALERIDELWAQNPIRKEAMNWIS